MLDRLASSVPEMPFPLTYFDQAVSWSSSKSAPLSLRDYIASRLPELAQKLDFDPYEDEVVKRVNELTEEEMFKVVYSRIENSSDDRSLLTGEGDFSRDDQLEQLMQKTDVGQRLLATGKQGIEFVESLAEKGKLKLKTEETS